MGINDPMDPEKAARWDDGASAPVVPDSREWTQTELDQGFDLTDEERRTARSAVRSFWLFGKSETDRFAIFAEAYAGFRARKQRDAAPSDAEKAVRGFMGPIFDAAEAVIDLAASVAQAGLEQEAKAIADKIADDVPICACGHRRTLHLGEEGAELGACTIDEPDRGPCECERYHDPVVTREIGGSMVGRLVRLEWGEGRGSRRALLDPIDVIAYTDDNLHGLVEEGTTIMFRGGGMIVIPGHGPDAVLTVIQRTVGGRRA